MSVNAWIYDTTTTTTTMASPSKKLTRAQSFKSSVSYDESKSKGLREKFKEMLTTSGKRKKLSSQGEGDNLAPALKSQTGMELRIQELEQRLAHVMEENEELKLDKVQEQHDIEKVINIYKGCKVHLGDVYNAVYETATATQLDYFLHDRETVCVDSRSALQHIENVLDLVFKIGKDSSMDTEQKDRLQRLSDTARSPLEVKDIVNGVDLIKKWIPSELDLTQCPLPLQIRHFLDRIQIEYGDHTESLAKKLQEDKTSTLTVEDTSTVEWLVTWIRNNPAHSVTTLKDTFNMLTQQKRLLSVEDIRGDRRSPQLWNRSSSSLNVSGDVIDMAGFKEIDREIDNIIKWQKTYYDGILKRIKARRELNGNTGNTNREWHGIQSESVQELGQSKVEHGNGRTHQQRLLDKVRLVMNTFKEVQCEVPSCLDEEAKNYDKMFLDDLKIVSNLIEKVQERAGQAQTKLTEMIEQLPARAKQTDSHVNGRTEEVEPL